MIVSQMAIVRVLFLLLFLLFRTVEITFLRCGEALKCNDNFFQFSESHTISVTNDTDD